MIFFLFPEIVNKHHKAFSHLNFTFLKPLNFQMIDFCPLGSSINDVTQFLVSLLSFPFHHAVQQLGSGSVVIEPLTFPPEGLDFIYG